MSLQTVTAIGTSTVCISYFRTLIQAGRMNRRKNPLHSNRSRNTECSLPQIPTVQKQKYEIPLKYCIPNMALHFISCLATKKKSDTIISREYPFNNLIIFFAP
jgi:hypothetical protein